MKLNEIALSKQDTTKADAFIKKMYEKFPHVHPFMRGENHVMAWGEGDDQELGIFELEPSKSVKDGVELYWFQAYPMRKGVGTRAMKVLQDEAKKDGLKLTLFPRDNGKPTQSQLVKFYKSLGFKMIHKGGKTMVWEPPADLEQAIKEAHDTMKLNQLHEAKMKGLTNPKETIEDMADFLEKHFDGVDTEPDRNRVHFVNKTNAKANVTAILKNGKWSVLTQGNKDDIWIEDGCTRDRVVEIAKSLNNKWFKENDPRNDD